MPSWLAALGGVSFLPIVLAAVAVVDLFRTDASRWWLVPILAIPCVGPLAWLLLYRLPWGGAFATPAATARAGARRQLPLLDARLAHWRGPALLEESGECLLALDRPAEAEARFREAIGRGARGDRARVGLAAAVAAQGRHREAAELLETVAARAPAGEAADRHLDLGRAWDEAGEAERAEPALRRVLLERPSFEARVRLARLLLRRGASAEARALLEEVERDGRALPSALARNHRAWIAAARRVARGGDRLPGSPSPRAARRFSVLVAAASAAAPPRAAAAARVAAPVLLGLLLMSPGLGDPFGGFLGFSEAWYTLVARGFEHGSLLRPEVAPGRPDFNIPPLFAWLLHLAFGVLGTHEAAARLVAILGALLAVAALALVEGAPAALLLASTPAFVLVGRNVQPDGWSLGLALAAHAAWSRGRPHLSAACFGLAILAKPTVILLPFALALAATLEARGPRWIGARHLAWSGLAALPAAAWGGIALALHRAELLAGLRHGEGAFEWPTAALLPVLAREVVSAFLPVLAVLLPFGARAARAERALRPACVLVAFGAVLFAVMHYHGYYLVAWLPAAAVLAARPLRERPRLTAAAVALNAAAALLLLGGHELGRDDVVQVARAGRGATFVLPRGVHDGYWTLVALYGEPRAILSGRCATGGRDGAVIRVPASEDGRADLVGRTRPRALAAFGLGLVELPEQPHRLAWGRLRLVRTGPGFGLVALDPVATLPAARMAGGETACP